MTRLIDVRSQVRLRNHASSLRASCRVVGAISRVKKNDKEKTSSEKLRANATTSAAKSNGRATFLTLVRAIVVILSNDDGSIRLIETPSV